MMTMDKLFDRLRRKHFLSIGRAGIDFYPEPPGTEIEHATQFSAHIGGSAGNIAVALAKLGCKAELVTCFSDDAIGRFTANKLHEFGVDTSHCRVVGGEARNTLAVVETRLENCQSVIYRNGAADFELNSSDVDGPDYDRAGGVILSGTALANEPSRTAIFHAIERAVAAGTPVVIDMDYRPYSWASPEEAALVYSAALSGCDIIIGNEEEFGVAAGGYGLGRDYAADLLAGVPALKPTGAGDAFMGGLMAGLANAMALEDAVVQGSAAAALVVTHVACSTAMPTPEELLRFINSHTLSEIRTGDSHEHSTV
jgi:5-dehydro-2-deoxygluconokinase